MKAHNIDSNGHTILDSLMITILKSHTSCVPGDVNEILAGKSRFEGEEVDTCGRWNADSDAWLSLLARGEVRALSSGNIGSVTRPYRQYVTV